MTISARLVYCSEGVRDDERVTQGGRWVTCVLACDADSARPTEIHSPSSRWSSSSRPRQLIGPHLCKVVVVVCAALTDRPSLQSSTTSFSPSPLGILGTELKLETHNVSVSFMCQCFRSYLCILFLIN